jgi:hypothetical protein
VPALTATLELELPCTLCGRADRWTLELRGEASDDACPVRFCDLCLRLVVAQVTHIDDLDLSDTWERVVLGRVVPVHPPMPLNLWTELEALEWTGVKKPQKGEGADA